MPLLPLRPIRRAGEPVMKLQRVGVLLRSLIAILCTIALLPRETLAYLVPPVSTLAEWQQQQGAAIPSEQLDSLVAPIALYPDALLAQVLVASTYPLELIQLQQWLSKNGTLKDKALVDAVAKQS